MCLSKYVLNREQQFDPDYPTSGFTVIGLARITVMLNVIHHRRNPVESTLHLRGLGRYVKRTENIVEVSMKTEIIVIYYIRKKI
jgi:hypothetical protein